MNIRDKVKKQYEKNLSIKKELKDKDDLIRKKEEDAFVAIEEIFKEIEKEYSTNEGIFVEISEENLRATLKISTDSFESKTDKFNVSTKFDKKRNIVEYLFSAHGYPTPTAEDRKFEILKDIDSLKDIIILELAEVEEIIKTGKIPKASVVKVVKDDNKNKKETKKLTEKLNNLSADEFHSVLNDNFSIQKDTTEKANKNLAEESSKKLQNKVSSFFSRIKKNYKIDLYKASKNGMKFKSYSFYNNMNSREAASKVLQFLLESESFNSLYQLLKKNNFNLEYEIESPIFLPRLDDDDENPWYISFTIRPK